MADIKGEDFFEGLKLINQTRLSVIPVSAAHFDKILAMSQG
ncbi:MAG: EVE domain-containing protein [Aridibacter sp.]